MRRESGQVVEWKIQVITSIYLPFAGGARSGDSLVEGKQREFSFD